MDHKIDAALLAINLIIDTSGRYVLGFRNTQGLIFRKEKVDSLGHFVNACENLPKHGFDNEIKDMSRMKQGCDAIFTFVEK